MLRIGSRAQVMHGNAKMTGGGLKKKDLKYNKHGKIVSKKASRAAKKSKNLIKAGYITKKGVFGSIKKGGMNFSKKYNNEFETPEAKPYNGRNIKSALNVKTYYDLSRKILSKLFGKEPDEQSVKEYTSMLNDIDKQDFPMFDYIDSIIEAFNITEEKYNSDIEKNKRIMEDYFKQYPILRKYIKCNYLPYRLYKILITTIVMNPNCINKQFIKDIINNNKFNSDILDKFLIEYKDLLKNTDKNIKLLEPQLRVMYTSQYSPTYHQNGSDSVYNVYMKYNSLCYIINYNNGNELKGTEIRFRNEDEKIIEITLPACLGFICNILDRYIFHRTPRLLRSNINKNIIRILIRTYIQPKKHNGTYAKALESIKMRHDGTNIS